VFDLVGDGDGLAVIAGRGNQEEVRQARVDRIKLKDAGVFALFVFTDRRGGLHEDSGLLMVLLDGSHSLRSLSELHRSPSIKQGQVNNTDRGRGCTPKRNREAKRVPASCSQPPSPPARKSAVGLEFLSR